MEAFLCRAQRLPCCGDDAVFDSLKTAVARLGCFRNLAACASLQVLSDRRSRVDTVAMENFERVAVRCRVRSTGTGGDVGGIIARDVRNDQREHGCLARRREPPPLNRGKVFSHGVDVLDRCTAAKEFPRRRFQRSHADGLDGKAEQRRAPAGYEGEQQVARPNASGPLQNFLRSRLARFVGNRVSGLDHLDSACRQSVPVAGDDQALQRRVPRPILFDHKRHRGGGLARADHEGPARRWMREMAREDLERVGGGDGGLKALYEQLLRIHAWTVAVLAAARLLYTSVISSIDLNTPLSGSQTWSSTVK